MSVPFLDVMLGKLYARGIALPLRGGLDFGPGLQVTPGSTGYTITPDPAVYAAAQRDSVTTSDATPTALTGLEIAVAPYSAVRIEARFFGRENQLAFVPKNSFKVLSAVFRRVEDGALAQWGATLTGFDQADDLTWGAPTLVISGNSIVPRVTGNAATSITWTVDLITRVY